MFAALAVAVSPMLSSSVRVAVVAANAGSVLAVAAATSKIGEMAIKLREFRRLV